MRNIITNLTQVIPTFSWYTLFSQTREWRPRHSGVTVSLRMDEMPSQNVPVQRLKVTILPLDVPCPGPVTHSGEILTTGKSHGKKPDRFSLNDKDVKKVEGADMTVDPHFGARRCVHDVMPLLEPLCARGKTWRAFGQG